MWRLGWNAVLRLDLFFTIHYTPNRYGKNSSDPCVLRRSMVYILKLNCSTVVNITNTQAEDQKR